jgi:hypothetical protein
VIGALIRDALQGVRVAGIAGAIGVQLAIIAHSTRRASAAAAIYVCLRAVLSVVDALTRDALQGVRVAGVAGAIGVHMATLAHSARSARSAAAIHVRFQAVRSVVGALTRDAQVGARAACVAGAVGVRGASHSDAAARCTSLTCPCAVTSPAEIAGGSAWSINARPCGAASIRPTHASGGASSGAASARACNSANVA